MTILPYLLPMTTHEFIAICASIITILVVLVRKFKARKPIRGMGWWHEDADTLQGYAWKDSKMREGEKRTGL